MPGSNILHTMGFRIRAVGRGSILPTYYSLDRIRSRVMKRIPMHETTPIKPVRLGNFSSQGIFLKLETTEKGEFIKVNDVTPFITQIYTEYPNVE